MNHDNDNTLADDLLKGADEIAAFTGISRRSIYHAISTGALPSFRIGAGLFARKSTLMLWISAQESASRVAA